MDTIGRDDVGDAPNCIEFGSKFGIHGDGGVQEQSFARQADDCHPCADGQSVKGLRPLDDPNILGQRPETIKQSHAARNALKEDFRKRRNRESVKVFGEMTRSAVNAGLLSQDRANQLVDSSGFKFLSKTQANQAFPIS